MGTMLFSRGVAFDQCFDELNRTQPELIESIHREYLLTGAEHIAVDAIVAQQRVVVRDRAVADRRARFVSTLIALRSAQDPEPLIAIGRWHGEILLAPAGQGGFGYDPLMFIPALGKAAAELEPDVKNALSHRAIAARQMLALMREVWRLD